MDIKKKIELEKKANSKEKGFKDKREDFFKKEEKQIQKTLYIDESNGTKKQDGNLSGIPALVWESATISCNEW